EAVENAAVMRRMDFRIFIQAARENPISIRRINVMENLIGPNPAGGCGFIEPLVVIGHEFSFTQHEIGVMPGLIAPDEDLFVLNPTRGRCRLESDRLARRQVWQDKVQFGQSASEARPRQLRGQWVSVRSGEGDRGDAFVAELSARDRDSHRDIVPFVLAGGQSELKRRSAKGPARHEARQNASEEQSIHKLSISGAPKPGPLTSAVRNIPSFTRNIPGNRVSQALFAWG